MDEGKNEGWGGHRWVNKMAIATKCLEGKTEKRYMEVGLGRVNVGIKESCMWMGGKRSE